MKNGQKKKNSSISYISSISLASSDAKYTGEAIVPEIKIKNGKNKKIKEEYYDLTYKDQDGNSLESIVNPGTYTVKIKLKGKYKGSVKESFKIKSTKYTINYYGNQANTGSMDSTKCETGKSYLLNANTFQRTGYRFTGWNTRADGTGIAYLDKQEVKDLTLEAKGHIDLYAQWQYIPGGYTNRDGASYSDSYKNSIYYQNLMNLQNLGSTRDNFVAVAESQVGYHESDSNLDFSGISVGTNNYTEYGRWCNLPNGYGGWCSAFVSWCLYMSDVQGATVCTKGDYRTNCFGGTYYEYTEGTSIASIQKGDIIACTWDGAEYADHVEIVYNDPITEGTIKTISGNSGDGKVVRREYDLLSQGSCRIYGYIRMNWQSY